MLIVSQRLWEDNANVKRLMTGVGIDLRALARYLTI